MDIKHLRLKPQKCSDCDYKTASKGNLQHHINSTHEGIEYECSQCTKKCTSRGNLKSHIKTVHEA